MFLDFVHCLIFLKKQNVSEADPVSETFWETLDNGQSPKHYFFQVQYTIVITL
jgi:hypothetical protein